MKCEVGDRPGRLVLGLTMICTVVLHSRAGNEQLAPRLSVADLVPANHARLMARKAVGMSDVAAGRGGSVLAVVSRGRGMGTASIVPSVLVELE